MIDRISDFSDWMVGFRGVFCGFSGGGVIFAGFSLWVKGLFLILMAVFGFMNCLILYGYENKKIFQDIGGGFGCCCGTWCVR